MDNLYDYKKFAVLYVDDEEKSLTNFTRAFDDVFRILTATNAQDGLKLLELHSEEVGVLMTCLLYTSKFFFAHHDTQILPRVQCR